MYYANTLSLLQMIMKNTQKSQPNITALIPTCVLAGMILVQKCIPLETTYLLYLFKTAHGKI
jgi:hypothetical protein